LELKIKSLVFKEWLKCAHISFKNVAHATMLLATRCHDRHYSRNMLRKSNVQFQFWYKPTKRFL